MCIYYWQICIAEISGRCLGVLRLDRSEPCTEGQEPSECPDLKDETGSRCCQLCEEDLESMVPPGEDMEAATLASRMECVRIGQTDSKIAIRSPFDITNDPLLKDIGDKGAWFMMTDGRPLFRRFDSPRHDTEALNLGPHPTSVTARSNSMKERRYGDRERSRSPGWNRKAAKDGRENKTRGQRGHEESGDRNPQPSVPMSIRLRPAKAAHPE